MKTSWEPRATTKHLISSWRFPLVSINISIDRFHMSIFMSTFNNYVVVKTILACFSWMIKKKKSQFLYFFFFFLSEKLLKGTLSTGLRAKHHLEMTTAIALISTNSSGATGTGQPPLCWRLTFLYLNEPSAAPIPPVCFKMLFFVQRVLSIMKVLCISYLRF